MGAVNTTYTFTATDTITSTKMNNIIDQTTFTNDAVFDTTLAVAAGKLKVNAQGITSNELADDSVRTNKIFNLNVTTGKIADLNVTTEKIADLNVTTGKIANLNVTTGKIADANITASKLDGAQTGTALIYGVRAFGTVTSSGTALQTSKGNVSGVIKNNTGRYTVSFITPMPITEYSVVATVMDTTGGYRFVSVYDKLANSFSMTVGFRDNSGDISIVDSDVSFIVIA